MCEIKRTRIMVGCNLLTSQDSIAYVNHMQMWYNFGRRYSNIDFLCNMPRRQPIDTMRNNTARLALDNDCDYIFFYDDDVIVPIDGLMKLIDQDADIASGLTFIRQPPFKPMIFNLVDTEDGPTLIIDDDYETRVNEDGIIDCFAVGFSCVLLKISTLKKLPPPYFMTGSRNTEDVYYCCKLKDYVSEAKIIVDTTVDTKHLLDKEYVDSTNVKSLREFYLKESEEQDRSFERASASLAGVA